MKLIDDKIYQEWENRWNTEKRNKMNLEGEIKDAKMSSFSSDFQILIKH